VIAVGGGEVGELVAAAEHHAAHLRARVLEGEIPVAGGGTGEVGDLALHPQQRQLRLQRAARHAVEFAHGEHRQAGGVLVFVGPVHGGQDNGFAPAWFMHSLRTFTKKSAKPY
jgi:hypothetical protein